MTHGRVWRRSRHFFVLDLTHFLVHTCILMIIYLQMLQKQHETWITKQAQIRKLYIKFGTVGMCIFTSSVTLVYSTVIILQTS